MLGQQRRQHDRRREQMLGVRETAKPLPYRRRTLPVVLRYVRRERRRHPLPSAERVAAVTGEIHLVQLPGIRPHNARLLEDR